MKRIFPVNEKLAVILLRIVVGLLLAAHGCIRIYAGTVNDFGGFLNNKGFPAGYFIAWFLTVFEIAGGLLMALGYVTKGIACIFIIELLAGILLVHAANGWFVVGYQSGGMEYSVLLIVCLIVIAAGDRNR
jgi:putative oxidoreductase